MLFMESLTFFADDFAGKKLEILLDLFAGRGQQRLSLFHAAVSHCRQSAMRHYRHRCPGILGLVVWLLP